MVLAAIALLAVIAALPWASPGVLELDGDYYGEAEVEDELAEGLGEVAWNLGAPAVLAFVAYKHVYLAAARRGLKLPLRLSWALRGHILASIALGVAGLAHGAMLLEAAGPVEWASGVLILALLVTGTLLYYAKSRRVRRLARLVHAQRLLSILLLVVVAVHVALVD